MVVRGPPFLKTFVVFPFSDLRRFIAGEALFLTRPSWINVVPNKDFVRALGGLKSIHDCGVDLRGLDGWVVEPFACDVTSGPKFDSMPAMSVGSQFLQWKVAKRLLFFDAFCTGRIEYHFEIKSSKHVQSSIGIDQVNKYICSLKIRIPQHIGPAKGFDEVDFGRSGYIHTKLISERTLPCESISSSRLAISYVKNLRPCLMHIIDADDDFDIGSNFVQIDCAVSRYINIYHDRIRIFGNIDIPIWVLKKLPKANERDVRDLCLYIRRLHSDYESIKSIFLALERSIVPLDEGYVPEGLEQYIREILGHLRNSMNKLARRGAFSAEPVEGRLSVMDLAGVSIHDIEPGLRAQIALSWKNAKFRHRSSGQQSADFWGEHDERVSSVSAYIQTLNYYGEGGKVVNQTVNNSTGVTLAQTGGDAQINIDQTFNSLQDRTNSVELVQAVADLKDLLDRAIESGDVNDPETISRDFKELSEEITSKDPRKKKIGLSGDMIIEAIKESSGLISSVSKAVEVVKSFF